MQLLTVARGANSSGEGRHGETTDPVGIYRCYQTRGSSNRGLRHRTTRHKPLRCPGNDCSMPNTQKGQCMRAKKTLTGKDPKGWPKIASAKKVKEEKQAGDQCTLAHSLDNM